MEELICDVCKKEPGVAVACVPGIPMSVAYGKNCLKNNAHPTWALRANVALCGGVNHVWPSYLQLNVYSLGEYISLDEELKRRPLTEEELNPLRDHEDYKNIPEPSETKDRKDEQDGGNRNETLEV